VVDVSWDTSYLAGLISADGTFKVTKSRAEINVRSKNQVPFIHKIREGLEGFGTLSSIG